MMVGTTYTVPPIPPDPSHTTYVDVGKIRFGVEYRLLDGIDAAKLREGVGAVERLAREAEAALASQRGDPAPGR